MDFGNVSLQVTCPTAPLQIEGTINGTYVYYRDRHAQWTVGFGESPDEALERVYDGGTSDYVYNSVTGYNRIIDAFQDYAIAYLYL